MGLARLWQIERARGGIRELQESLTDFDRVLEDLQHQHGQPSPALKARYRDLRRWLTNEAVKRRRRYEDVVHHPARQVGWPDPFVALVAPAGLDGVLGALEHVLQARRHAGQLVAGASAELEHLADQERAAIAHGALGATARLPFDVMARVAAFVERNLRLMIGVVVFVIAWLFLPDWRPIVVIVAIVALFADRLTVALRP